MRLHKSGASKRLNNKRIPELEMNIAQLGAKSRVAAPRRRIADTVFERVVVTK